MLEAADELGTQASTKELLPSSEEMSVEEVWGEEWEDKPEKFKLMKQLNLLNALNANLCILHRMITINEGEELPVWVLIDSSAEKQYMASHIAAKLPQPAHKGENSHVHLSNGAMMTIHERAQLWLHLSTYWVAVEAQVIDLPDFDLILGIDWLWKANPVIDWRNLQIWVWDNQKKGHTLIPLAEKATVHPGWRH